MHINATADDLEGNNGIGRYVLLPGSAGRAREIAERFNNFEVKKHDREHHLYMGTIGSSDSERTIDVATVATGMGCPSAEIIIHELFQLGGKRFLRVGTAGSLQPNAIGVGAVINALASVRDGAAGSDWAPTEFPALASLEINNAATRAAEKLGCSHQLHAGVIHCKSSLYAREMGAGPMAQENEAYMQKMTRLGVLASEMETATLFVQSQFYNHVLKQKGSGPSYRMLAGALLAIIGDGRAFDQSPKAREAIDTAVSIALETIRVLHAAEAEYVYRP
jgi:uridine phosphorylase